MKMVRKVRNKWVEQFREKGSNILNERPRGIGDFLDEPSSRWENTQIHKTSIPQMHTPVIAVKQESTTDLGRLHLQIRKDLIEKLLDVVFERKRDPTFKGRDATQRSVIEDALEHYFRTKRISKEGNVSKRGNREGD